MVVMVMMVVLMVIIRRMLNDGDGDDDVAVARRERGLQGFDDDPNWWLHPLLPYAHRTQCGQVHHRHHRHRHPQIYNTSRLLLIKGSNTSSPLLCSSCSVSTGSPTPSSDIYDNTTLLKNISIDVLSCCRYISISNPLSSLNSGRQRRRAR